MTTQSSFSVYSYADNSYTGTLPGADPGFQTSSTYDPLGGSLPTGGSASYSIGPSGSSYATSSQGIAAIDGLFSAILIRAPTSAELSAAQSYLASGATLGALRAAIAFGGAGTIAVQSVIQNVLGRSATASDTPWIQTNQRYLAGGGTLAQVISALALSSAGVTVLDGVIQNVQGRSATASDTAWIQANQQYLAGGGTLAQVQTSLVDGTESTNDITGFLTSLDVSGAAQASDLGQAEAGLAGGQTINTAASNLISSGILNGIVAQVGQDLNQLGSAIVAEEQSVQQAVLSDIQALSTTAVTWSTIVGHVSSDIMNFVGNQFGNEPPNPTSLTSAQTGQLGQIAQIAQRSGTDAAPAGATLIDGSPLLTAFCSVFDPSAPTYHSYAVEYIINNGSNNVSQQLADQYLASVAVPGNIASSPLANGAVTSVYAGVYIGQVTTFLEPGTNTAINFTLDGHLFDTGVVGLTVSEVSGHTILQVYGCGQNTDPQLAAVNQYAGSSGSAFNGVAANLQNLINPSGNFTVGHQ